MSPLAKSSPVNTILAWSLVASTSPLCNVIVIASENWDINAAPTDTVIGVIPPTTDNGISQVQLPP